MHLIEFAKALKKSQLRHNSIYELRSFSVGYLFMLQLIINQRLCYHCCNALVNVETHVLYLKVLIISLFKS